MIILYIYIYKYTDKKKDMGKISFIDRRGRGDVNNRGAVKGGDRVMSLWKRREKGGAGN